MSSAPDDGPSSVVQSPLHRALGGDAHVGEDLYRSSFDHLVRLARRRAAGLPSDIQDEIPGEMWALVYGRGLDALDASATTDAVYLSQVHRNAVEAVRASYRPPLTRSRTRRRKEKPLSEKDLRPRRRPAVILPPEDVDLQADPSADVYDAIDTRIDLERRMAAMEPEVAAAVTLIEADGATITEAAKKTGLSRQMLGRRLQELAIAA